MERQEKNKALSDHQKIIRERDQAIHSYEQLKKEHIGLRQNIERMYSQAQAQQQVRYNDSLCHQLYSRVLSFFCAWPLCGPWKITLYMYSERFYYKYIIGFWTHKKESILLRLTL